MFVVFSFFPPSMRILINLTTTKNSKFLITAYRVGELPNYLKEMKIKEAEKNRLESLIDVNCPAGHIVLSEEDRLDAFNIAKKSNSFFFFFFFVFWIPNRNHPISNTILMNAFSLQNIRI